MLVSPPIVRATCAPELALGEHLVLGEELHAADLRDRVLLRRRRAADDLVLVHTARERPRRSAAALCKPWSHRVGGSYSELDVSSRKSKVDFEALIRGVDLRSSVAFARTDRAAA